MIPLYNFLLSHNNCLAMNTEPFTMTDSDDEYENDENSSLNIKSKIVYNINNNKAIIKLTAGELIRETRNWIYNRDISTEKVKELKENYIANNGSDYFNIMDNDNGNNISPAWIISIVYDKQARNVSKIENSKNRYNLFIVDGQHRREVIRELLEEKKIVDNIEVLCIMYTIDNCEKENKNTTLELFKKINNNLQLKDGDFPKILALQIVEAFIKNKELVPNLKIIKNEKTNKTGVAYEPLIHERELFELFNKNYALVENLSCEEVISNILIIKQKICWKDFDKIYTNTQQNIKRYEKAKKYDFWLNLKSSPKCKPTEWIKYIANPNDFNP